MKRRLQTITDRRSESEAMRTEAVALEDQAVILRMKAQVHDEDTHRIETDT